ncbi:hypothetical protein VARIO8X_160267 [Burkholderiales bacterium 8X]|nr:hypothetical protein VARIO8X_160267 [Burkholderiales bacterium 8X]
MGAGGLPAAHDAPDQQVGQPQRPRELAQQVVRQGAGSTRALAAGRRRYGEPGAGQGAASRTHPAPHPRARHGPRGGRAASQDRRRSRAGRQGHDAGGPIDLGAARRDARHGRPAGAGERAVRVGGPASHAAGPQVAAERARAPGGHLSLQQRRPGVELRFGTDRRRGHRPAQHGRAAGAGGADLPRHDRDAGTLLVRDQRAAVLGCVGLVARLPGERLRRRADRIAALFAARRADRDGTRKRLQAIVGSTAERPFQRFSAAAARPPAPSPTHRPPARGCR